MIVQELTNNDINVALITETWTKDTQEDLALLNQSELCQGHYDISTHNRPGETRGGGIALIFHRNNNIKLLENGNTATLEYVIWRYTIRNKPIHIIRIYHPPPKGKHNTINGMFIDDITELLINKLPQYQNSIILGDFNVHIEDQTNADRVVFNETMRGLGLEQHISGPTHVRGNTLDLIFTQLSNSFNITNTTLHGYISDHCMVSVNINIKKQKYPIETKDIRDRTELTGPTLAQNFTPPDFNENTTIDEATSQLNTELHKVLDATAPIKSIKFTNRPKHPWLNKFIREQKSVVKNHERKWEKVQTTNQWQAYKKEKNVYNRLLIYHKNNQSQRRSMGARLK